jgi:REP element-mobilizing transposase RayT
MRYVAKIDIEDTYHPDKTVHLFLQMEPKLAVNLGAFPDLLLDKSLENKIESRQISYAVYESNKLLQKYQFWQLGNHAEEIYSEKFMWSKIDYIHFNPVRAGIVLKPQDYAYSSASNYTDGEGILDVAVVQTPLVNVMNPNSILKYISYDK